MCEDPAFAQAHVEETTPHAPILIGNPRGGKSSQGSAFELEARGCG